MAPHPSRQIAIITGEPSGDSLGAGLIRAIHAVRPEIEFIGVGGPQMSQAGCRLLYPMDRIGVIGVDGLVGKVVDILRIRRALYKRFVMQRPTVFIGIDVPDFNLTLERQLKRQRIPCVHYVSPTVWAWRGYRIRKIRRAVDHMMTLFPFEAKYYQTKDIPVSYVGHPIADEIVEPDRLRARKKLGIDANRLVIGLLPGSRRAEVEKLGPLFVASAERLLGQRPAIEFLLPFANHATRDTFDAVTGNLSHLPLRRMEGQSRLAMEAADIVVLASGTAALEAALLQRPQVVVYRLGRFSYWLMRRLRHVDHYAMPNHLMEQPIVPELIQENATVENIVNQVNQYLTDPGMVQELAQCCAVMARQLRCDANVRARDVVLNIMDRHVRR